MKSCGRKHGNTFKYLVESRLRRVTSYRLHLPSASCRLKLPFAPDFPFHSTFYLLVFNFYLCKSPSASYRLRVGRLQVVGEHETDGLFAIINRKLFCRLIFIIYLCLMQKRSSSLHTSSDLPHSSRTKTCVFCIEVASEAPAHVTPLANKNANLNAEKSTPKVSERKRDRESLDRAGCYLLTSAVVPVGS